MKYLGDDKKGRRSALKWCAVVAVCLAVTAVMADCQRRKASAMAADELQPVDVARAVTDSVTLHVEWPGFLEADKKVDVVGRVNGTLLRKHYVSGQKVNAGQVLFSIEPTVYADDVRKAEAALATARSQYDYAASHYEAVCRAKQADAVSQMELEQALSARETAAAALKSSQAALQTARTNLGYCTVTAPTSGRITDATISEGSYVAGAGAPVTLATIYDDSTVLAKFQVEEDQQAMMNQADAKTAGYHIDYNKVKLRFDESLGHDYNGEITYIAPDIDRTTGTMVVKVRINNPYGELRDGMYCHAVFPYGFEPNALLVKNASIATDQLGRYLYTVNDSNRVVYTPVQVGQLANDSMRIITGGIVPGQMYVTKALLKVRDGMPIKPVLVK